MKRRIFLKASALSAIAVSATGFISFDGNVFVGDCETTTDILGPFYRPGSPVRNNLVAIGEKGELIELLGKIKHQDCTTPYKHAKVELWHCDGNGVYDNSSPEFNYRGTTFSDNDGNYSFQTVLPVPYDIGNGLTRPAHFHLMITAEGYQPLVTQLYFNGDKHIENDVYANSESAKKRILEVSGSGKSKKVHYDVSMSKVIPADPSAIDKLLGIYVNQADKTKIKEFFKRNNSLWLKNEVFGEEYRYIGYNTFEYAGMPGGMFEKYTFEISGSDAIKCTLNYKYGDDEKGTEEFLKA